MLKEFKQFAMRGNVVDLAVGVIIGAAFGKIISSFVSDILMPPIGLLLGKVDFSNLFLSLSGKNYASLADARAAGAATLNYGLFINQVIDFTIVAFAVYLVVKSFGHVKVGPPTKACPFCATDIPEAATRCPHCTSQLK